MTDPKHIILSRTDSLGDVVLTLPLAGYLKHRFPRTRISFIGCTYTQEVIRLSEYVDGFINWDDVKKKSIARQREIAAAWQADWIVHVFPNRDIASLARKAGILNRVGTSHRLSHWLTCNRKVPFTRRRSELHEAQLNFKLLSPLGIHEIPPLAGLHDYFGFTRIPAADETVRALIDPDRFNLILHPKSQGSAREWGLANFEQFIRLLPEEKYKIFITGTKQEGAQIHDFLDQVPDRVVDTTGQFDLRQFLAFLSLADGIVAASTGPLHIAAALGKKAIGLYAPMKPIHPGRWAPLGKDVHVLVKDQYCEACRNEPECRCLQGISPHEVAESIKSRSS